MSNLASSSFPLEKDSVNSRYMRNLVVIISLIAITILIRILVGPRIVDDAYITFRYAHNIVAGNGFVYNVGEQILGTTTPFFTLLLAASHLVFDDLEVIATTITIIADSATVVLIYLVIQMMTLRPTAAIAGAILYAFPRAQFALGWAGWKPPSLYSCLWGVVGGH